MDTEWAEFVNQTDTSGVVSRCLFRELPVGSREQRSWAEISNGLVKDAMRLNQRGLSHLHSGRHHQSETLLKIALRMIRRHLARGQLQDQLAKSPATVSLISLEILTLNNLATLDKCQQQLRTALEHLQEAVNICRASSLLNTNAELNQNAVATFLNASAVHSALVHPGPALFFAKLAVSTCAKDSLLVYKRKEAK
jgi:hypothetical protein